MSRVIGAAADRRAFEAARVREVDRPPASVPATAPNATVELPTAPPRRASPETQQAARSIFSRRGTELRGPTGAVGHLAAVKRGVAAFSVAAGVRKIDEAAAKIDAAGDDEDAVRRATLDLARTVKDVLAQARDAKDRARILEETQGSLGSLGRNIGVLDGDETRAAIAHLSSAAETVGPTHVDQLTGPIAQAAPEAMSATSSNLPELSDAVGAAVKNQGALFSVSLVRQLQGSDPVQFMIADSLARATASSLQELKEDFSAAHASMRERQAQLAEAAAQWGGVFTPDEMQAGMERFRAEHGEFQEADKTAVALSRALEGAAAAEQGAHPLLRDAGREALGQVASLAETDAGARAIGAALIEEGRGEPTYLRTAAGHFNGDEAAREDFENAIQRSIVATQADALSRGDTRGLVASLRGAEKVIPGERGRDFARFADRIEKELEGLPPAELALGLASSARSIVGGFATLRTATQPAGLDGDELARPKNITSTTSFQVFGAVLGAATLGKDLVNLRDGADAREVVGTVVDAAGLTNSIAGMVMRNSASTLLKRGLPVVGAALAAFDTASALRRGDELGAMAAAAPLAGALAGAAIGATSGSFAPGVGTVVGGAVGGVVGLGISVTRSVLADSPDEAFEKSIHPFLQGALEERGMSAAAAERASLLLRDVSDDYYGVAPHLCEVARRTGQNPAEVLDRLLAANDESQATFVKAALAVADNGELVRELQREAVENDERREFPAFTLDPADVDALVARYRAL